METSRLPGIEVGTSSGNGSTKKTHRLMASFDAALVQMISHISEQQPETDIEFNRQPDDLSAGLEAPRKQSAWSSAVTCRSPAARQTKLF